MATAEVIQAVQQLLESEGVLHSIRAQLRASVINALNANSSEKRKVLLSEAVGFLNTEAGKFPGLNLFHVLYCVRSQYLSQHFQNIS